MPRATAIHWILPFASSLSDGCLQTLPRLGQEVALPNLHALLAQLQAQDRLEGEEYDLVLPHEKTLARQFGWNEQQPPWAAWWAQQDGVALDRAQPWGLITPCHWMMGRDQLTMLDPQTLALSETESRTLFAAVEPLFSSEGWQLVWGQPLRWYVSHASLCDLPTASLDRVIGRNPDVWLTDHPLARPIRRLQAEVQMLLYNHAVNETRESLGQQTVNSFWISGCGRFPPSAAPVGAASGQEDMRLITTLRQAMLSNDMAAWQQAWEKLDATVFKEALAAQASGTPMRLTLCGERHAQCWAPTPASGWAQRLRQSWRQWTGQPRTNLSAILSDL